MSNYFLRDLVLAKSIQSSSSLRASEEIQSRGAEFKLLVLLVLAVLFGGGGAAYGLYNLVVQIAALIVLALSPRNLTSFIATAPRAFVALVFAVFLLPLLQVIPLPEQVWSMLPGRILLQESLELIGKGASWYPLSLAPTRTLIAFFSLIPVLAVVTLAWSLNEEAWIRVSGLLFLLSLLLFVFGSVQLVSGNNLFIIYTHERIRPTFLYSVFANHNTAGVFFLLALMALLVIVGRESRSSNRSRSARRSWQLPWVMGLGFALLALAVILTQSRSSIIILIMIVAAGAISLVKACSLAPQAKAGIVLAGIALAIGGGAVLQNETRLSTSFDRFEELDNIRPAIWEDTVSSAKRFWPVGSGISSFPEVFEVDETLEHVWRYHAARAHNDYLEVAQEAGFVGVFLLAGGVVWLFVTSYRAYRGGYRRYGIAAAGAVGIVALQSFVDYPLRNQAILCLSAYFISLLVFAARSKEPIEC